MKTFHLIQKEAQIGNDYKTGVSLRVKDYGLIIDTYDVNDSGERPIQITSGAFLEVDDAKRLRDFILEHYPLDTE